MIDVKKLALNFLVLSTVVSLVVLYLSGPAPNGGPLSLNMPGTRALPENAFLARTENLPLAFRKNLSGAETNITQATAKNLADVILALNPAGPQTIGGESGFVLPTTTVLTGYLAMENPQFKLSDLWSSPDAQPITPSATDDAAANRQYAQSFQKIMKETMSSPDFLAELGRGAATTIDANFMAAVVNTFGAAVQKLNGLPVPASLAEFHKNFLVYLEDQRNVMAAISMGTADPIKSLMVLSSGPKIKQRIASDLSVAMEAYQKLDREKFIAKKQNDAWGAITAMLSDAINNSVLIPTAAAQSSWPNPEDLCGTDFASSLTSSFGSLTNLFTGLLAVPVADQGVQDRTTHILENTSGILGVLLFDCQSRILTQAAKVDAVTALDNKVTNYVQRDGDPAFIANYADYFGNAAIQGATKAYQADSVNTCPEFQQDVNSIIFNPDDALAGSVSMSNSNGSFTTSDYVSTTTPQAAGASGFGSSQVNGVGTGCQLKNNADLPGFYNDFTSDPNAWDDYFALLTDPTNNIYGTIAGSHDDIDSSAISAGSAAKAESIANSGYRSDVNCGPNSYTDQNGNTICPNQSIVTPGGTTAGLADKAVDPYKGVVNANDLAQLDRELADSLGSQLMNQPQQGLYGLGFKTGNSLSSVCQSFAISGVNTNPVLSACNNMVQQIMAGFTKYMNFINQIGSLLGPFL